MLSHTSFLFGEELIFSCLPEAWLLSKPPKGVKTKTQLRHEKGLGTRLSAILTKKDFSKHILSFMILGPLFNLSLHYTSKNEKPHWQNTTQ